MPHFQILSLNGGGIRGAFGCSLLAELEEQIGKPLVEYFDLIAGTSTGAIIAAGLAAGQSARELVGIYLEHGDAIFHPREPFRPRHFIRPFFPAISSVFQRLTGQEFDSFFRARYCPDALRGAFVEVFGEKRMSDLTRSRVIIPSINLSDGQTHVFRTPHLPESGTDPELKVVDVLRAATAAPTYFPHKVMPDGAAYCDGGLWAVAPAVLAVAEAMKIRQQCSGSHCPAAFDTSDIRVLSIGTGRSVYSLKPPGGDAGLLYWASRIADVMSISQMQGVQTPLEFVLGDRYREIDFDLPDESWTLDAIDRIPELVEFGKQSASTEFDELAKTFFQDRATSFEMYL